MGLDIDGSLEKSLIKQKVENYVLFGDKSISESVDSANMSQEIDIAKKWHRSGSLILRNETQIRQYLDLYLSRFDLTQIQFLLYINGEVSIPLMLYLLRVLPGESRAFIETIPQKISSLEYAFFSQIGGYLFKNEEIEGDFSRRYIGPIYESSEDLASVSPSRQADEKKKLLIVGYFSGPCRTVGVQRINYWLNHIKEISNNEWSVEVATAVKWQNEEKSVHHIPDHNIFGLLNLDSNEDEIVVEGWKRAYAEIEQDQSKHVSTLGYYWRYELEKYFELNSELQYDSVIITGNPFSYFDFATFAYLKWNAEVFLDYRDPFANNPRFNYSTESREYARYIEQGYNFQANHLLTVNQDCIPLTVNIEEKPITIIDNGFDETLLPLKKISAVNDDSIHFVHAGAIYYDRPPGPLMEAIEQKEYRFHHIGKLDGIEDKYQQFDSFIYHGENSYQKTLEIIGTAHCGVVFVSKAGFETPTKLYDYIAMGLDILVCTLGEINKGALESVLSEWPGVYWCKNNKESLNNFLESYRPKTFDRNSKKILFSRRWSTEKLIKCISDASKTIVEY